MSAQQIAKLCWCAKLENHGDDPRIIHVNLWGKNHYDVRPFLVSAAQPAPLPLSACTCSQAFFQTGTRGSVKAPFHVDNLPLDMAYSFARFNTLAHEALATRLADVVLEECRTDEALVVLEKRAVAYAEVRVCSIMHACNLSLICTHYYALFSSLSLQHIHPFLMCVTVVRSSIKKKPPTLLPPNARLGTGL